MPDQADRRSPFAITGVTIGYVRSSQKVSFALVLPLMYRMLPLFAVDRFLWVRTCTLRHVTLIPGRLSFQRTTIFHRLSDLLTQFQVDRDYTWEWHDMKGVVYMRLGLHPSWRSAEIYIGSTSATVSVREASRRRKYIQRCHNKLAFYEPAIKVWHRKRNFYHGVTLVLCQVAELPDRLATETALIRSLRPDLNHPFVSQTLSQLRLHEARFVLPKPGTGQQFAQRAQRFRKNHICGWILTTFSRIGSCSFRCIAWVATLCTNSWRQEFYVVVGSPFLSCTYDKDCVTC